MARQGRLNSNYRGGCPTINILHRDEWTELMDAKEEDVMPLLQKFNRQYMYGTYPSKLDIPVMFDKVKKARESKATA
jgi:hypothetical protein